MKIVVNRPMCVGHARCAGVAPRLFPLDDVGRIATDGFAVPADQREIARRGARACPERVISVVESDDQAG